MKKTCPYCNKDMEPGYIQCRDALWWAKKKRPVAALPSLDKTSVKLGTAGLFNGDAVAAYLCRACKNIMIVYGGK